MASGSLTLLLLLFSLGCSNAASTGERGEDPGFATLGPADCVQIEEHGCCWENYWWDDATNETGVPDRICEMACHYSGFKVGEYIRDDHLCCCTEPCLGGSC